MGMHRFTKCLECKIFSYSFIGVLLILPATREVCRLGLVLGTGQSHTAIVKLYILMEI